MTEIMLSNAPTSWRVTRLGELFAERKEKVSDKDYPALSVTKNGIVPQLETAAKTDDGDNRKCVRVGDFVINSRSDRKGSAGLSLLDGSVSLINIVLEPRRIEGRFAHYLLRSGAFQEEFYRWGHGIVADLWTTRYFDMKNIQIALPGREVQKAIADFLDNKTGRIDHLIRKKERLSELLEEKLDRDIGHLLSIGTEELQPEALRWVVRVGSGEFIPNTEIEKSKSERTPIAVIGGNGIMAYSNKVNAPANTVVVGRVGALCGNVHLVREPSWVTDNALVVRIITERVIPEYLVEVVRAANLNTKASKSAQPLITGDTVKSLKAKFPGIEKQELVCAEISSVRDHSRKLQELVRSSIDRLYEFRSTLITAAVTGQINVASWSERSAADRRVDANQES